MKMFEKRRFVFFIKQKLKGGIMIEIISIKTKFSLERMKVAVQNNTLVDFDGINQLEERREVQVHVSEIKPVEVPGDYFYFKGSFEEKVVEGFAGTIKDNNGTYGRLILHI